MRDAPKGNEERSEDSVQRDTAAGSRFKPYYRPRPRLTPSVRLAQRVIRQLRSQLGTDWHDRAADGKVTITITLDVALIDRAIWEFAGGGK